MDYRDLIEKVAAEDMNEQYKDTILRSATNDLIKKNSARKYKQYGLLSDGDMANINAQYMQDIEVARPHTRKAALAGSVLGATLAGAPLMMAKRPIVNDVIPGVLSGSLAGATALSGIASVPVINKRLKAPSNLARRRALAIQKSLGQREE